MSLYRDRRAANIWHRKIREGLEGLDFKVSECDPCLFMQTDCIICLYIDDVILHAKDDASLDQVLKQVHDTKFAFSQDEDFNSYLGILVEDLPDGTKKLSQPGLTKQLLEMMGMSECNPAKTPMAAQLHNFADAEDHDGAFNF